MIVAIFCVGGMIGALGTGYVADRFGRKGGLLYTNAFVLLSAACMGFSKAAGQCPTMIYYEFVTNY